MFEKRWNSLVKEVWKLNHKMNFPVEMLLVRMIYNTKYFSNFSVHLSLLIRDFLNSQVNLTNFCWNSLLLSFSRLIRKFSNSRGFLLEPINRELGEKTIDPQIQYNGLLLILNKALNVY